MTGCGSCSIGGNKARVLSCKSREVFQSVYLLRENFGMDPAPLLLLSHAPEEVAAASQQHGFPDGPSRGVHPHAW